MSATLQDRTGAEINPHCYEWICRDAGQTVSACTRRNDFLDALQAAERELGRPCSQDAEIRLVRPPSVREAQPSLFAG